MRRKHILGLLLTIAAIAMGSIAGIALAQGGFLDKLRDIYTDKPGDEEVIAVVNGQEAERRSFRRMTDATSLGGNSSNPFTDADINKLAIISLITRHAAYGEAQERGIQATPEEVQAVIDASRATCEKPEVIDSCTEAIRAVGYTDLNAYFEAMKSEVARDIVFNKLIQTLGEEHNIRDLSHEEVLQVRSQIMADIRARASIEWKDAELEQTYRQGIQELPELRQKYEQMVNN